MKRLFVLAAFLFFTALAFATDPAPKVLAAFQKTFEGASGVKWYSLEDGYSAFFKKDSIRYRVTYDGQGNIMSSIRYYAAQQLPFLIKAKITRRFSGMSIYGVTEITVDEATCYRIVLADATSWITLHSDAYGNAFVLEKYDRPSDGTDLATH